MGRGSHLSPDIETGKPDAGAAMLRKQF